MMLGKVEARPNRPRDGRHCDLCGCSQPAVRCDKCGCQIFCLSCDDMYHRHPKRRFHLRKAVDPTPPTPQARPVLPMKVSHMPTSPGDPSKMPLPPPRKKKPTKSFFDTFRRRSPSADNSPPLPKKEYSWTDRLGNIKKFMSNRPLPPLPSNGADENDQTENMQSTKNDLSFIHKRVDDKPPQLPQRSLKPTEFSRAAQDKENLPGGIPGHIENEIRTGTLDPSQINRSQDFNRSLENQWNNNMMDNHQVNTLNRQFPPGGPGFPGNNMHQSASATDLPNLPGMDGHPGMPPMHYPHYPMNPHLPPHYPYPMYPPPQFSNYPQYFGNSFANLSSQPTTTDGDFSDQSEASSRHHGRKYPFRKRAKRSQSVMVDRMQYPGQFYPFGPFPPGYGPGPWGAPFPMEAPPSPASSIRSLNRVGRTRRRKKLTSEDDDEEFSMSSSPMSRPKSSSSERPLPAQKTPSKPPKSTSSEEEESEEEDKRNGRNNRKDRTLRRNSDPRKLPSPIPKSPQVVHKKVSKHKHQETLKHSDAENIQASISKMERGPSRESNRSRYSDAEDMPSSPARMDRRSSRESNSDPTEKDVPAWTPSSSWQCKHCTFINPVGNRICQVCCKTATTEESTLVSSRPNSASAGSRKQSLSSEKSCSSPEKRLEEEDTGGSKETQDMAVLNTALDEAEKEITRGLEELMKLKEDFKANKSEERTTVSSPSKPPTIPEASSTKPVYKSSGKLRTSILDKIIPPNKQTTASTSTSTETQTGPSSKTDRIVEARRLSTSSTTSDAYNSPTAQSPQLERTDTGRNSQKGAISKSGARKEMSCQTQPDDLMDYYDRKNVDEEAFLGNARYGPRYGDRIDNVQSPTSFMYDRGYGMMQRSHSRQSLFTGRMNDFGPMDYGFGARPMYRSVSRSSLTGDYPEGRLSEFSNLRKPEYYLSMEELVERRRQEAIRVQGLELVRMIREAEQQGFTADDIQVALNNCGKQNPLEWLRENWKIMVENVIALSTSYANDKKENDIGTVSENEAREALRLHKGHIWASVTECVETRQRKFLELKARGKFSSKDITDALTSSQGDVELAYSKLTKSTSKPFLMRIWGAGEGAQNKDGALPKPYESLRNQAETYQKDYIDADDVQSDELWDEEEEDVEWDEDYDEQEDEDETEDINLQTCRDDVCLTSDITTPDSDRSDYCDAFGANTLERNISSPESDTFFVIPDTKQTKKSNGLLSKLAALRKEGKESKAGTSKFYDEDMEPTSDTQDDVEDEAQQKSYNPLNVIKNTFSAIRDTVSGSSKSDKKLPCAAPERRTIIVRGQIAHESLNDDKKGEDEKYSVNSLKDDPPNIGEIPSKETGAIPKHSTANVMTKSTEKSKEMEIKKNLVDTDNAVKEIRSALEANSLKDSAGSKSPLSRSPKIKVKEINQAKKSTEELNSSEASSFHNEKLSPEDNLKFLKKETSTEQRKSPSSKIEKQSFPSKKEDKQMVKDSKLTSDKESANTAPTEKAKQTLESNDSNTVTPDLAEHPPVFATVKNDKSSLKKESTESEKNKSGTNEKSEIKKIEITEVEKKINLFDKKGTNEHEQETKTDIPYIDSSTSIDIAAEIASESSTSNDGNNLNETAKRNERDKIKSPNKHSDKTDLNNISGKLGQIPEANSKQSSDKKQETESFVTKDVPSKTFDATKPHNDQKSSQADQVNSSDELDQASKDLKQLKKREESSAKALKTDDIPESGITESDLKHSTEKVNQQDNKALKQPTSEQKLDLDNLNKSKSLQNMQKDDQETNLKENLKLNGQSEIRPSENGMKASSAVEPNESNISKRSSPVDSLLFSKDNDTKSDSKSHIVINKKPLEEKETDAVTQNSDETHKIQVHHPEEAYVSAANEAISDLNAIKASTFQTAKNNLKSSENEMSSGLSEELNRLNDEKPLSILLKKDKTSNSPTSLYVKKEDSPEVCVEDKKSSHLEKTSKIETPISLEAHDPVPSTSSSTDCSTLSVKSNESSKEKSSSPDASSEHQKNSVSEDFVEPLHSSSSDKAPLLKADKKKGTDDETSSPVKRSISPSVGNLSTAPAEKSKNEARVPEIQDESQNLAVEINKPSISENTPTTGIIHDKSNQSNKTPTDVRDASNDSEKDPPKIISVDILSTSKGVEEIPVEQSESTKSVEPIEQNLNSNSPSTSCLDSIATSPQNAETTNDQHSKDILQENEVETKNITNDSRSFTGADQSGSSDSKSSQIQSTSTSTKLETVANNETSLNDVDAEEESESSDNSRQSSLEPPSPVEALRNRFEGLTNGNVGTIRPQSPYRRMSFRSTKAAIALERTRDTSVEKPWFPAKPATEQKKPPPKRSIKQQLEIDRKVRKLVADKKVRTYRKAEIVVQLMDLNFQEEEAIQAASECSTLELAISFLQQDCLLCAGKYPVSQMISMVHCPHKACRECIRAYFTVQIRDRNIMELLCPFCNEPDIFDEDIAQDYFNHLDIMLKKLVDPEIHELFQRKLRDRVLMRDPNFRWCSQCSSGFIAMENLTRLVCPDCNAVMCASCRRPWEKEHNGISCEEFAALKDANDVEAQAAGLAKLLTEDGIDCPMCHFRYQLAKGGCMHFRCTQCQHDFCSGCSRPFKMGQKCGVSEFCAKLGLHAHHPRNCLFYLRDKEPQDLQRLLDMSGVKYDRDLPEGMDLKRTCQVMEQKETADGMVDDCCGKEVEEGFAGLCRIHYVEYLGQLVNKNKVDPIQIFDVDDLELVLRRANIRLPYKKYRETDDKYRGRLVQLIEDELPLDKMDGS
ncbi:unnamed protein product [Larinioides sclopetarius]|uniref:RBR-type E3 ubiquitin transferase n=1 Tax=Larinioides sclopetarius TaxID=280406 RepID=A0AAV2AB44_9ARAC